MAATQSPSAGMTPHWHLEQLQLSRHRAFVNGWCFVADQPIARLELQLRDAGGRLVGQFPLSSGNPRRDVQQAYPQHDNSLYSGFVGVGAWPRPPRQDDQLVFMAVLENGTTLDFAIPAELARAQLTPTAGQRRKAAWAQWLSYCKRALGMVRQGQLKSLYIKAHRQLSSPPQKPLGEKLTATTLMELGARAEAGIYLVVDHRLGGGANHYRDRMIKPWLQDGAAVLTLTYHLPSLQSMLIVDTAHHQKRFSLKHESDLIKSLDEISITAITYNTAVSFVEAEIIPGLLLQLRKLHKAHLTVLLHDFFSVCPSHFLIHADGYFCNIPDLKTCRDCLRRNPHGFTSLFSGDILQWRQAWGPLLRQADALVAFSESTAALIRKAYENWPDGTNWLQERPIEVRPHVVDYLHGKHVSVQQTGKLVIGVVGQIGFHKGSELVRRLSEEIQRQGRGERIAVIGSLEINVNREIVHQTGPYSHRDLASMIEKSGANVILFPSIWPETFSYVTQEILELDLPLACLDLGAQAERVKHYSKGHILTSSDPSAVLEELRTLLKMTYPAPLSS